MANIRNARRADGGRSLVSCRTEHGEHITPRPKDTIARIMGAAMRRALLDLPPEEHAEAMGWAAGYALAGFAFERGVEAAKSLAFAQGHALAVAAGGEP